MISPTVVYWLSASLLLVALSELSFQRHAVIVSAAASEFHAAMTPHRSGDLYKRRFMFGRRSSADHDMVDDLTTTGWTTCGTDRTSDKRRHDADSSSAKSRTRRWRRQRNESC